MQNFLIIASFRIGVPSILFSLVLALILLNILHLFYITYLTEVARILSYTDISEHKNCASQAYNSSTSKVKMHPYSLNFIIQVALMNQKMIEKKIVKS